MQFEQLRDQHIPIAGGRGVGPALDASSCPCSGASAQELLDQRPGIGDEMGVLVLEQLDSLRLRHVDADALRAAHAREQRFGKLHGADPLALGFDVNDRARGIESLERGDQLAFEGFLRRLRVTGKVAQQRPAMPGERFEIERLRAFGGERAR